jgi:hypothetical protein
MKRDLPIESEVERRFRSLAAEIISKRVRPNGLTGIRIYRDSQFELAARGMDDPVQRELARHSFCQEFSKRLYERFRDHPLAKAGLLV